MNTRELAYPKGKTQKQLKARKDRQEAQIKLLVRAACVVRDGFCRRRRDQLEHPIAFKDAFTPIEIHMCNGRSEWAHFGKQKRARTRGMTAEARHTTAGSLMLCTAAHEDYDQGRLLITALTRHGCDGRLKFRRAK